MKTINKVKWILGISLIFALIATTNLLDRHNFQQLNHSVTSIYEDQLMTKDLLLDMHTAMMEKKIAIATRDDAYFEGGHAALEKEVAALVERFSSKESSYEEKRALEKLRSNLNTLQVEKVAMKADASLGSENAIAVIDKISDNLNDLSDIQLEDGRRQVANSDRATNAINLFTHMEIIILIILAIMVQVIIVYKPKSEP